MKNKYCSLTEEALCELYDEQRRILRSLGAIGFDELAIPVIHNAPLWKMVEELDDMIRQEVLSIFSPVKKVVQ